MIPRITITNMGHGDIRIDKDPNVPIELALWVQHKINDKFLGVALYEDTLRQMELEMNYQLKFLIDNYYIRYNEFKDEWVIISPLFKWAMG